jgi:hypothetical protein
MMINLIGHNASIMRPSGRALAAASTLLLGALLNSAPVVADSSAAALQPDHATFTFAQLDTDNYAPSIPSPPPQRNEGSPRNGAIRRRQSSARAGTSAASGKSDAPAMSNLGCSDIPTQDAIISYIGCRHARAPWASNTEPPPFHGTAAPKICRKTRSREW